MKLSTATITNGTLSVTSSNNPSTINGLSIDNEGTCTFEPIYA